MRVTFGIAALLLVGLAVAQSSANRTASIAQIKTWIRAIGNHENEEHTKYRALLEIGDRVLPFLIAELDRENSHYRAMRLAQLLDSIGGVKVIPDMVRTAARFIKTEGQFQTSPSLEEECVPYYVLLLSDKDPVIRGIATAQLAEFVYWEQRLERKRTDLLPHFRKSLMEDDERVWGTAVRAIGMLEDHQSVPRLLFLLDKSKDKTKYHIITALGEIGDRKAVQHIVPLLMHDDYKLAWRAAAIALQKLVEHDDLKLLLPYLDARLGKNVAYVANVAGYTRNPLAIQKLEILLTAEDERTRQAANNAILRIRGVIK